MGFISKLAAGGGTTGVKMVVRDFAAGNNSGREQWRRLASGKQGGARDFVRKDQRSRKVGYYRKEPVEGGSYGRSSVSESASYVRLLQAMRSMAPGGWSDDRYEETRQLTGIQYIAIQRICCQWSQAEFQVFKEDDNHPDGKRPVTRDDPPEGDRQVKPYDLVKLLKKPNNQDSFGMHLFRCAQQKYQTGTALTWLVPNQLGTPMEMFLIPTCIAIPQPAINPDFPDGFYRIQPIFPYGPFSSYPTPTSAVGAPIPAQWMIRHQFPHPLLRYEGFSPLTALRLHIDEATSIDRSRWYKMQRSINPSAVLNMEGIEGQESLPEEEIDRIRAQFEADHQGPANSGRLYVSAPGSKIEEFGASAKEMDYHDSWAQLTEFVLAGLGISKSAAFMNEASSYSTLWASIKQFHAQTLKPDLDMLAADYTRSLGPYFGDDLIIEINCPRIDDHELVFSKIDKGMAAKCITKNQVLKLLDMPVTSQSWGEEIAGSDPQQQQGGMPGMPGAAPPGGMPTPAMGEQGADQPPQPPPLEETDEMPNPGDLGAGSLGPRKMLPKYKSLMEKYRKRSLLSTNGINDNHIGNGYSIHH